MARRRRPSADFGICVLEKRVDVVRPQTTDVIQRPQIVQGVRRGLRAPRPPARILASSASARRSRRGPFLEDPPCVTDVPLVFVSLELQQFLVAKSLQVYLDRFRLAIDDLEDPAVRPVVAGELPWWHWFLSYQSMIVT